MFEMVKPQAQTNTIKVLNIKFITIFSQLH